MAKMMTLVIALAMVLAMSATAFAGTNSITVTGAQTGETYKIYKMLDLAVHEDSDFDSDEGVDATSNPQFDGFSYTLNDDWKAFWTTGAGKDYIDTNTVGTKTYVVWESDKKDATSMEAFGKAAAAWAKDNSKTPVDTKKVADADEDAGTAAVTAAFTGLDNGYYLITTTFGTATTVASTPNNADQDIREKNSTNTTEKKVQEAAERNGTAASWGTSNDAAVGDTVTFRSKVTIAKNTRNVVYHDTMTEGLTWSGATTTKVYTDEACTTELAAANYEVAAGTGAETFTATFKQGYLDGLTEATTDVYVKYTAVLNDKAVVETADTNTGKVTWGDNGESTETTTNTDTRKFQILKYDGTDTSKNPLAGAKFQLFLKDKTTDADTGEAVVDTPVTLAVNSAGTVYRVVSDGSKLPSGYTLASDNKIVTLSTGNITIEGVDSDDYWLEETDAPTGYNKLENRIKVQVNANNSIVSEVENLSGTELPSTGGIGTTIFYILGSVLVIGGGILLISRRRLQK